MSSTNEERFWSKVKIGAPDECWEWQGSLNRDGYGLFYAGVKVPRRANRMAFFLAHGRWPEKCACHTCDNPPCCNPAHLVDRSTQWNTADSAQKGRRASGERNGTAKLTQKQVEDIRKLRQGGAFLRELSAQFNVSQSLISQICQGGIWRGPEKPEPRRGRPHGDEHWSRKHSHLVKRGEQNNMAKLTRQQVEEIRQLRSQDCTLADIGAKFGVSRTTIGRICSGRIWAS